MRWLRRRSALYQRLVTWVRKAATASVLPGTAPPRTCAARAQALGWPPSAVTVFDEDLGVSGASAAGRSGFAQLAAEVGLGQVGIVLSLECSRLARPTDTLISDADGIYHPALFNDRLLLGLKGIMSEALCRITPISGPGKDGFTLRQLSIVLSGNNRLGDR